jgi:hypothetical protein
MISELNKNYPEMIVEKVSMNRPDHAFNVLNRDQSTSIFNPEKWNDLKTTDILKRNKMAENENQQYMQNFWDNDSFVFMMLLLEYYVPIYKFSV